MKTPWLRVVMVAAVLTAIAVVVLAMVVIRRDPYRPGTSHEVSVHMTCANVDPLVLEGRVWDPEGSGPTGWSIGSTHAGHLDIVAVDQGVFTPNDAGSTIRFHRSTKQFSEMPCALP